MWGEFVLILVAACIPYTASLECTWSHPYEDVILADKQCEGPECTGCVMADIPHMGGLYACQQRCENTTGCRGVNYRLGDERCALTSAILHDTRSETKCVELYELFWTAPDGLSLYNEYGQDGFHWAHWDITHCDGDVFDLWYRDTVYSFHSGPVTWQEADESCARDGGSLLATADSEEENVLTDKIGYIASQTHMSEFWIAEPDGTIESAVCDTPVPLLNNLPDTSLTASSEYAANHGAVRSRYSVTGSPEAWVPHHADQTHNVNQWIEADLGASTVVSSVSTKGRGNVIDTSGDMWVKLYKIMYSQDGVNFMTIQDEATGQDKIFNGNTDRNSEVTHDLGITARYVRLSPQLWHNLMALRWSIQGCRPVCDTPVPSLDDLPDTSLTASSEYAANHGAVRSRYSVTGSPEAWVPHHADQTHNVNQWIEADFGAPIIVSSVSTKGRGDADQWVKIYKIMYSQDGVNFAVIKDDTTGEDKIFNGNTDRNTEVTHDLGIIARYLRLNPQLWHNLMALRWSIQGCRTSTFISDPMEYSYWADGEPNNVGGAEDCVLLNKDFDYKWMDYDCAAGANFICEKKCSSDEHGFKKSVLTGSCYAFPDEFLPWDEASAACSSMGSHLVHIGSKVEHDFIRDEIKRSAFEGSRNYWIGGKRINGAWTLDFGDMSESCPTLKYDLITEASTPGSRPCALNNAYICKRAEVCVIQKDIHPFCAERKDAGECSDEPRTMMDFCSTTCQLKYCPCQHPHHLTEFLPNTAFEASSAWEPVEGKVSDAWRAKLYTKADEAGMGAWIADYTVYCGTDLVNCKDKQAYPMTQPEEWIQVTLDKQHCITGIITRGRQELDQWVTKYAMSYKENIDDAEWTDYIDRETKTAQVFYGNKNRNGEARYTLPYPGFKATVVKLTVKEYYWFAALRFELLGCDNIEGCTEIL